MGVLLSVLPVVCRDRNVDNLCWPATRTCIGSSSQLLVNTFDRSHEHAMKLAGASYEEVHEAGGGINFTVNAVRKATKGQLMDLLLPRL